MTVRRIGLVNEVHHYVGLSSDEKTTDVPQGSIFQEIDTGKRFIFFDNWKVEEVAKSSKIYNRNKKVINFEEIGLYVESIRKDGDLFFSAGEISLPAGATITLGFETAPNKVTIFTPPSITTDKSTIEVDYYKNGSFTGDIREANPVNMNFRSDKVSGMSFYQNLTITEAGSLFLPIVLYGTTTQGNVAGQGGIYQPNLKTITDESQQIYYTIENKGTEDCNIYFENVWAEIDGTLEDLVY